MSTSPVISLVVPCYKVGRYLPDFLESLDKQTLSPGLFEVIFVIDGCPEDSEQVVRSWIDATSLQTRIVVTENRGVSSARNTGLSLAKGTWVSFPDPDDVLDEEYLSVVSTRLKSAPHISMLSTRLVRVDEGVSRSLGHILDYRYLEGSREVDLRVEPQFLQLAVHTAFFRRNLLNDSGVRFDTNLRVFEDGKFVAEYLLAANNSKIFVDCEALYFYKVRDDGSGALASSGSDLIGRYLTTSREAHKRLLQVSGTNEKAPEWLQFMVLYDLYWIFAAALRIKDSVHGAPPALLDELNVLLREVFALFSYEVLFSFNIVKVRPEIRAAWLTANAGAIKHRWVRRYRFDRTSNLVELRYLSSTRTERDSFVVDGKTVEPAYSKWRGVLLFGQVWVFERIVWVVDGHDIQVQADNGQSEGFFDEGRVASDGDFSRALNWQQPARPRPLPLGQKLPKQRRLTKTRNRVLRARHSFLRKLAVVPPFSRRYRNLWILMDRDTQANDNAEALYRFLANEKPEVNTRFVIRKEAPDYSRLRQEGFKVLPFGGIKHFLAVRNASHIVSSHIDEYVVRPFRKLGVPKTWNYVFLQHGVTHNDLSRWLNTKDVQLLMTATEPEAAAFVEDGGPYIFTDKEIRLTGFPRHDGLAEAVRNRDRQPNRRSILIMPTWRSYLLDERNRVGNARRAEEGFASSEYVQQWSALLGDAQLLSLARRNDLQVVLLPHPNLEPHLDLLEVPDWIEVASYQTGSVAALTANAAITVTDYSSQAFEGAFAFAPCVYFQFDRAEFYGGTHIVSPGYFDVVKDGFGPVVEETSEVVGALDSLLDGESDEAKRYLQRIADLYPSRDGRASERVFEEISELRDRR